MMSLHKLSAGGGVDYLLKHISCGDAARVAATPLTSYYLEPGYPPGRWMGHGLDGLGDGIGIAGVVSEEAMTRLFGLGLDPVTGRPLGTVWRVHKTVAERIAGRMQALDPGLDAEAREGAITVIEAEESARPTPIAVSGFDLTFTLPKSASILWALADPATQAAIAEAHADAVADCLAILEAHALFTRTGKNGAAQLATLGALAVAFDHWDTRSGDPNLHTHLVIANKIQGLDGVWRTVDAKGLYAATVAISELYDVIVADRITAALGVDWAVTPRLERSALFEIDGVNAELLAEFSARSVQVDAAVRDLLKDFHVRTGRSPTRPEMIRIRQHGTRASRPIKQLRPLHQLLLQWRDRATALLPLPVDAWVQRLLHSNHPGAIRTADLTETQLLALAAAVIAEVSARRSTWTRWNLLAEAARATKTLRTASTADRLALLETVTDVAIQQLCLTLTPPDLTLTPTAFLRPDGVSAFRRHYADIYTSPQILTAEQHLLDATMDLTAPQIPIPMTAPARLDDEGQHVDRAPDQLAAVHAIGTSGRRLDVLVGPAGSGKTTTMRALRTAWEATHGAGSVIGLAPSAAAAAELGSALGIGCENTAKWIHHTTRPATTEPGVPPQFQLRAGQLLIVDEASLAGTLVLDELRRQTVAAGAKLLLVGDHRQLSAISAGGAFGLLATETGAVELTSLWRFRHAWEAQATRLLRVGDPTVIDTYQAHARVVEGPAEVMEHDVYTAWAAEINDGKSAVLIAADIDTVTNLNTRARADRITAATVEPDGVPLHDGTTAGVGDTVITRRNDRSVRTSSGAWIRNGDLWTVTNRTDDGSLTLTRNQPTGRDDVVRASVVRVNADYVVNHVELGYATTAHRAQGITVDTSFALLRPGMSREVAYVALTRGREANHAFIATDLPDPAHDGAPEPDQTGRHVFEQIMATSSAELSATATLRKLHHDAESLATLGARHETLIQHAAKHRWQHLITHAVPVDIAATIVDSPAYGPLIAALRRAEHDGLPIDRALPVLAADSTLSADDRNPAELSREPARDPAAVLRHRVSNWHAHQIGNRLGAPLLAGLYTPAGASLGEDGTELRGAILELENRIKDRANGVARDVLDTRPAWLHLLGPEPRDPQAHARWETGIVAIAVYRDAYGITDPHRPTGTGMPNDRNQRRALQHALALTHAVTPSGPSRRPTATIPAPRITPTL
jgi:hypothetical protein